MSLLWRHKLSSNMARPNSVSLLPQPANPTTASTFSASQLGLTQGAVANQWLEEFIAFEQADMGEVMDDPLMPVDGDQPGSFMRMFDGSIRHLDIRTTRDWPAFTSPCQAQNCCVCTKTFNWRPHSGLTVSLTSHPTLNSIDQLDLPHVASMDVATLTAFKGETVIPFQRTCQPMPCNPLFFGRSHTMF